MSAATLTSKGQITIPKEIRHQLGLQAGDRLQFRIGENGRIEAWLAQEPGYRRLFGSLAHRAPDEPVGIEDMRRAIHERAASKHLAKK